MLRYLVFCGESYYASGGANDYVASFDDLNFAISYTKELIGKEKVIEKSSWSDNPIDDVYEIIEWAHIFDLKENKIVFKLGEPHGDHKNSYIEIRKHIST